MKKIVIICLCMALAMSLFGCGTGSFESDTQTGPIVMTDDEKEILSAAYGGDARIREGKLFSYQEDALYQLRAGMEYLNEKYPGHNLKVLTFTPATKFTSWAQFLLEDSKAQTYTLTVTPSSGQYECADTFYGVYIQREYDNHVENVLGAAGLTSKTQTNFSALMGMEIGPDTGIAEVIAHKPRITRQTIIYLKESVGQQDVAAKMQKALSDAGLYGSYIVYFVPGAEYGSVEQMEKNKTDWSREAFTCFDE